MTDRAVNTVLGGDAKFQLVVFGEDDLGLIIESSAIETGKNKLTKGKLRTHT